MQPKFLTMPKMKTHSGAKKRFKVTGKGKIKRFHAGTSHLKRKRTKKAKRNLRHAGLVDAGQAKTIRRDLLVK